MKPACRLRILVLCGPLHPMIGGVETVVDILATEFVNLGQEVIVATLTPSVWTDTAPYVIRRQPSARALLQLFLWADCIFAQGLTLRLTWPRFFIRKPLFVTHHLLLSAGQRHAWLKRCLMSRAVNIAVSDAVAATIPVRSRRIYNPYKASIFFPRAVPPVPDSLIFVGRLVPDKGIMILVEALEHLQRKGVRFQMTIVGDGPARSDMETAIAKAQLTDRIRLVGSVVGDSLAEMMSAHRVAVIPSLWAEPFGVVALEAIACGCQVVGTELGGLPEAIGTCGVVIPNGDATALADAIEALLRSVPSMKDEAERRRHLQTFQPRTVALKHLELFIKGKEEWDGLAGQP